MSAREERGLSESEGSSEERSWMRERALEMDSHQEYIGSEEWPFWDTGLTWW